MKKFKVTNESGKSIFLTWSINLLTPEQRKRWESYKQTVDYLGKSEEEINRRRRIPESIKLQQWVNNEKIGIVRSKPVSTINPDGGLEYAFELGTGETTFDEEQVKSLRKFEKKIIIQKLAPGESKPKEHVEGFLLIEELPEETPDKLAQLEAENKELKRRTDEISKAMEKSVKLNTTKRVENSKS